MNERERFKKTLLFGKPDKVPFAPGAPRESTLAVWRKQGLPEEVNYCQYLSKILGIEQEPQRLRISLGISFQMMPKFEEKVLEHKNGHYIVQDWMGAITEISDKYDYTYIREAKDFVTRKWHKFPVQNREDWEKMKERFNPKTPDRYPNDFEERCRKLQNRDYVVDLSINGPFWQMREWCGFESLCIFMIEDPEFVLEMANFWTEFVSEILKPILDKVELDRVWLSEDMAYKSFSMISPEMTQRFLLPSYKRWVSEIKESGCPIVEMDSDGYIGELIPIWIEAGINCCGPVEVAAGNDIVEYRRLYKKRMAFTGGIDKRAIAKGEEIMEKEVRRAVPPLLKEVKS